MKVNTSDPQILIRLTSTVVMSFVAACLLIMTVLKSTEDVSPPKAMERLGYGKVQQWEWFGGKKVVPVVKVVQQNQKLQDVKIDADLLGVMISGNDSSATIKFKGRPEQVFQQGDKLNSILELIEIQPFRVIVTENGIKKQLMMKKPDVIIQSEPIATVRAFLEITVMSIGWYLGGTVGIGTLLFAFGIGPSVALGLYLVGKTFN